MQDESRASKAQRALRITRLLAAVDCQDCDGGAGVPAHDLELLSAALDALDALVVLDASTELTRRRVEAEVALLHAKALHALRQVRYQLQRRRAPASWFCTCPRFWGSPLAPCSACHRPFNYIYVKERCHACGLDRSMCVC